MEFITPDFYALNPDVWVFGDIAGYRSFCDRLAEAKTSSEAVLARKFSLKDNSMQVVILRARRAARRPLLKIVERVVNFGENLTMELIINGNKAGYNCLIKAIRRALERSVDDSYDHWHVDEDCPFLVMRSVFLNIRGPFKNWRSARSCDHREMIANRSKTYLPPNVDWLKSARHQYEPIDPNSPHLCLERIP